MRHISTKFRWIWRQWKFMTPATLKKNKNKSLDIFSQIKSIFYTIKNIFIIQNFFLF